MPERDKHLARAQDTEKLAGALKSEFGFCVDWAVAMYFYSSLHWIDAFLAGKNVHPLNHNARDAEIERNGSISDVYVDYRRLKDLSRAARYEIPNFGKDKLDLARDRLERIKRHVLSKLI